MVYSHHFSRNIFILCAIILLTGSLAQQKKNSDAESAHDVVKKAVNNEDHELLKYASELPDFTEAINAREEHSGQTPLMKAVLRGKSTQFIRSLLLFGADTSIGERDGYTPMHGVGFQGRYHLVEMLVNDFGLDPNDEHEDGFTPLHRACWGNTKRHSKTVEALIQVGADPNKPLCRNNRCQAPIDATNNDETKMVLKKYFASKENDADEL